MLVSSREENVIVKKIDGPSVDDEYGFTQVDRDEEPKRSKIKIILPLIALLVGGGAFYLIQNSTNIEKSKNVETTPIEKTIKEKVVTKKEEEKATVIVKKSKPIVEKKAPIHYIEALALPTVGKKEKRVEELKPKKIKKVIIKKRTPSLVVHYEKIKPRIVHVKKGDTLAILAKRFYGNEMEFKRIIRANRRIKSAKTALRLGEKLVIPRKSTKKSRRYIIVEKGNTLALIAKKFYGDVKAVSKIIRANYKIKSSRSMLHLGQKVYVPQ